MTEAVQTEPMPPAVRAARLIMILDVALSLIGIAIMIRIGTVVFSTGYVLLLLFAVATTVLMGWLVFRWSSRKKAVRWSAVALEAVLGGGGLIIRAAQGDLRWTTLLGLLIPLAVVVLLLTQAAGRWFDR
ncbi:hypothetical protein ACFPOI_34710 [Nonomuraea angiospora]|uniref:Uncharacterized protein n=1 Tax=Nonomuraea angiospora TaxID=46172 RepID=A0ABR9M833_9ACTN|nr:hypothetical protein [Nonomuraea angiospora]MBE1589066.1 hypothetical protein [Nonomuraea angiospora]